MSECSPKRISNADIIKAAVAALFVVTQALVGFLAYRMADGLDQLRSDVASLNVSMASIVVQVADIDKLEQQHQELRGLLMSHLSDPDLHAGGFRGVHIELEAIKERLKRVEQ